MKLWIAFVIGAGLCWGTYVPLIAFGGKSLGNPPGVGNRLAAILCVGGAYVLLAVLIPLVIFWFNGTSNLKWSTNGLVFSSLAGVAGALGAICVVFATANAAPEDRLYIAPLIFALAPIINTLVSLFWHPTKGALHFGMPDSSPDIRFYFGILLAAAGTFMVLYSKESSEAQPAKPAATSPAAPEAK